MESNQSNWQVVILDDLREDLLSKVVDFLNIFTVEGRDPLWSAEHFQWKLKENPAGRGFLACAIADGHVVGTASITLKRIWYKKQVMIAGETGDTYTHPDYRKKHQKQSSSSTVSTPSQQYIEYLKRSIFGRLVHENTVRASESRIKIIYGTPNEASRRGYEKYLNYKSHPMWEMQMHRPTAKAIGSNMKLAFLFKTLPKKPLIYSLSKAELMLEAINFRFWEHKRRKLKYAFEETNQATSDFDRLWQKLKFQNDFSLVRDRIYFQHRFFDNPLAKYKIYKVSHKTEICGVIVTRVQSIAKGTKNCFIADWFYDKEKEILFPIMLAHAIHDNYSNNIYAFSTWTGKTMAYNPIIRKFGFFPRSKSPIIFYQNNEGKELLKTCLSLDFTIASSDNI
jgi:hypothetical protein